MYITITETTGTVVRINTKYIQWYKDDGVCRKIFIADGTTEPFRVIETMEELDSLIWLSSHPSEPKKAELEI